MRHCLSEEDIDAAADAAHGFVGADLAALCDEAAMAALRRVIAAKHLSAQAAFLRQVLLYLVSILHSTAAKHILSQAICARQVLLHPA